MTLHDRHVFVVGYPGDVGGANTECWHTVRLWRRFGLAVTFLPTWKPEATWRRRLDRIGCRTVSCRPAHLDRVEGLAGSTLVSFCNTHFLRHADRFRELGCRLVWVGCMNWLFARERLHYRRHGPFDRYVFQSRFQESLLRPILARYGLAAEQCYRIRGAFLWDDFPFQPRPHDVKSNEPFVVGRISRADTDKFSPRTWSIYGSIAENVRARVMGWNDRIERKLGCPPDWAECLPESAESARRFLGSLHGMVQASGGAIENWPRSGLEAMARGVPLVVENQGGWPEMVRHGETGLVADSDDRLIEYAARLARDEALRMRLTYRAREVLEAELADPIEIASRWDQLFAGLDR